MPRCRDGVSGWGHPPHVSPFVAIRLRVQSDLLLTGGRHSTLRFIAVLWCLSVRRCMGGRRHGNSSSRHPPSRPSRSLRWRRWRRWMPPSSPLPKLCVQTQPPKQPKSRLLSERRASERKRRDLDVRGRPGQTGAPRPHRVAAPPPPPARGHGGVWLPTLACSLRFGSSSCLHTHTI